MQKPTTRQSAFHSANALCRFRQTSRPKLVFFQEFVRDLAYVTMLAIRCAPQKVRPHMKRGATFPGNADVNYHLPAADLNAFAGEDA